MRLGWFPVLALICCIVMRDNSLFINKCFGTPTINSSHLNNSPFDDSQTPVPPDGEEGKEVKRLTLDSTDKLYYFFTISLGAIPLLCSILHNIHLSYSCSSRELLTTLHRLLI